MTEEEPGSPLPPLDSHGVLQDRLSGASLDLAAEPKPTSGLALQPSEEGARHPAQLLCPMCSSPVEEKSGAPPLT